MMKRSLHILFFVLAALGTSAAASAEGDGSSPKEGPPTVEQDPRLNINVASVDELLQLPGIGPSRAEAIVKEREKRRFRRVEDIMRVSGIGRKTFSRIRPSIRVR